MKSETPQILWHNGRDNEQNKNAPIYSISLLESGIVSPTEFGLVLATAGNQEVNLWTLQLVSGSKSISSNNSNNNNNNSNKSQPSWVKQSLLTTLSRHSATVNCVKFSPDGLHLATASDAGTIVVYSVPLSKRGNGNGQHYWASVEAESQLQVKLISGTDGIYDLDWSADSKRFTVGTLDHVVSMYQQDDDGHERWRCMYRNARDHSHYVQGIAMDPLGVYVASMSCDRTVRVYAKKLNKRKTASTNKSMEFTKGKQIKYYKTKSKTTVESKTDDGEITKKTPLFAEEGTSESFFRRLSWTTDGAYLVTPAALWEGQMATLLFRRHNYDVPAKILPGHDKPSRVVVANPVLFQLPPGVSSKDGLPYKSIFCVLTEKTILIYDTYHSKPIAMARGLHYSGLTDAVWTPSGHFLVVSSSDGYMTFLSFHKGELGHLYNAPKDKSTPGAHVVVVDSTSTSAAMSLPTTPLPTAVSPAPLPTPTTTVDDEETGKRSTTTVHILQPKKKKKRATLIQQQ